jgi:hypothetical protein
MASENQAHDKALGPAQCITADDSTRPAPCQAHENRHYRELAGRVTRALILEDSALAVLRKDQLTIQDRDTLEPPVPTMLRQIF